MATLGSDPDACEHKVWHVFEGSTQKVGSEEMELDYATAFEVELHFGG